MTHRPWSRYTFAGLALFPPVLFVSAWLIRHVSYGAEDAVTLAHAGGNIAGLLAISVVVVLAVLGSRFPWVERVIGLDRMLRFHKLLAQAAVLLILAHVGLRTWVWSAGLPAWDWGFVFRMNNPWPLVVARLGFFGFIAFPLLAFAARWGLSFRFWKPFHLLLYGAAGMALAHVKAIGSDFNDPLFVAGWSWLAAILTLAFFTRLAYALKRNRRFTWTVEETRPETADTTSLILSRAHGAGAFARRRAGQFAMIRRKRRIGWSEPHPFTISAPPSSEFLCFTIKHSGPFSGSIPSFQHGEHVLCEGPYGVFTAREVAKAHHVFIAGGVGITPFLSILRDAGDRGTNDRFTLIWANREQKDIIARAELEKIARQIPLKVVHVLSREQVEETGDSPILFVSGHVNTEVLTAHVEPAASNCYYICGPSGLTRSVLGSVRQLYGVKASDIRREDFFW